MTRSTTTFDPEWTQDDLAAALDWQHRDSLRCHGCGHPLDETMDPDLEREWDAEIVTCHGCEVAERATRAHNKQPNAETAGTRPRVFRRPPLPSEDEGDLTDG